MIGKGQTYIYKKHNSLFELIAMQKKEPSSLSLSQSLPVPLALFNFNKQFAIRTTSCH